MLREVERPGRVVAKRSACHLGVDTQTSCHHPPSFATVGDGIRTRVASRCAINYTTPTV